MAYKISGTKNEPAKIYVINEANDTLETQVLVSGTGNYEISGLVTGRKLIVARKSDGESLAYGYINAVEMPYTRGVFGGGTPAINVLDYITINTASNATDFGDLTVARYFLAACSDGHGGLG